MRIDIVTLFPEVALAPLSDSIIQRARAAGLVEVKGHQLRDWSVDKHRRVDDSLCGGGQGMLLKPEPLFAAVEELRGPDTRVILMTPQGKPFKQAVARELVLVKVRADTKTRSEIVQIADIFRAKIVNLAADNLIIELTGSDEKVTALLSLLTPFGIIELARTGRLALKR